MKKPVISRNTAIAATIGAIVAMAVHASGLLTRFEGAVIAPNGRHFLPELLQYFAIAAVAFAVAWFTAQAVRHERAGWLTLALIVELFALAWICGLYQFGFQPVPGAIAAIVTYLAALGIAGWSDKGAGFRLRPQPRAEAASAPDEFGAAPERNHSSAVNREPREFDGTVLVCDLANKYDLADTLQPPAVVQASERFAARTREILTKAGAYVHLANHDGVLAIFGFNDAGADHAIKAVRAGFELTRALSAHGGNGSSPAPGDAHVGISTGSLISAPGPQGGYFLLGESLELARRFCLANRVYGSRILIGPRSFELTNATFISRPIDFLSGVTAQERQEVYEPLALAADAPRDLIIRRDHFWNGVVLYREKRWGEAYAEFQEARGPQQGEDAPLHLYLRRLEPLALHLADSI